MKWPEPDLTQVVPATEVGLSEDAQLEILRTFNSLTNAYATVPEYIAYWFPGERIWAGDTCGCTDDQCSGHHHPAASPCGCVGQKLDTFHDDLAVAYRIREWLRARSDQAVAAAALEALRDDHRSLETRLDPAQQAALKELFDDADHLEPLDFSQALHHLGIDVVRPQAD